MTDTREAETNPVIRLVTLGSARLLAVHSDSSPTVLLRPGKPLALLIYLAALPQRTASREHLINLLWADADSDRGRRTLRQTIFQLRQLLGDNSITASGRDLCLDLSLHFDRNEFLAAATEGDNDKAVNLYTGPFLADFGVPGGAEFEHWADRERDRIQSAYVRSAESVIRYRLDHAQYDSAIREARRLRDFDRHREASWRLLLEALSSSGDHVSAVTEAEELGRFLESEDREPENLTRSAIARAKRAQAPVSSSEESSSARLVAELTGREREFSRLTSLWSIVKSGHFRHVHITAPPGIGKTRLLQDVYTRLRASGARAMWVTAFAGDRRLAYALASDIVGRAGMLSGASGVSTAAASSLIALNPKLSSSFAAPQGRAEGEEALRRRVHAVTELFEALADETPIAVFIDDMHWSDTVSRQLLKSALSRIGDCRIFLVTSARIVPDGSLNLPSTESMTLDPLDEHQVGQLVTSFGSLPVGPMSLVFVHALHEHTGGSPLLILENLHLAMERALLELADGEWIFLQPSSLIESISRGDVLEQRLRKLDDRLFRILSLLAIAEEPTDTDTIAYALASDRAAIDGDLNALEQHGLASADGELWRCAHDSIADTVLRMTPGADQQALHAALGQSIAERSRFEPNDARVAIRHLSSGGRQDMAEHVFGRAVTIARSAGDRRTNLQLAHALLDETSQPEAASRLVSSLPFKQRIRRSTLIAVASFVAIGLLVAAIVLRA
jgi:DNA-binding SARP family transcriptional activator